MSPASIASSTSGDRSKVANEISPSKPASSSAAIVGAAPVGPSVRIPSMSGLFCNAPATVSVVLGRIVEVDGDDFALDTETVEEPLAAQVECRVADLLVEADRVLDALLGEPLARDLAGLELRLPDVQEDAEVGERVRSRVHRDDRDPRHPRPP